MEGENDENVFQPDEIDRRVQEVRSGLPDT
jgi:hypothetical protein